MKTRYRAAVAIVVIAAGVAGSMYGAWAGNLLVAALSLVVFVAGFLMGYRIIEGLPETPDEGDVPDADSR